MAIAGVLFWLFLPERYTFNTPIQFANSITAEETIARLVTDEHFNISTFAENISGARALAITETGDLIVSIPNDGSLRLVYKDTNQDNVSDGSKLLLKGLNRPHGIHLHEGWLYVAETNAVLRIRFDAKERKFIGTPHYIIRDSFPGGGSHSSRTVKVGPDNKLYVSVGSSCNVCNENTSKRASIIQYDLDGKNEVVYASGLRNTVGFDWQPKTQLLYGVDNGRDMLGDDLPPEELNQINQGAHYGWPYEYGKNISDNDKKPPGLKTSPSSYNLTAHSAPLSLLFLKHNPLMRNTALIALHGSWNRSEKSGYKVVALSFSTNGDITERDFITGFEHNETVIGRPVDLTEDKQGNIYLSDDYTGRIYKISTIKEH
ncbi:MAG TPA: sorbosone dehydrogenase family protein [Cycloclasticus sp.]|nr:sorbosone dehydrogenase family protein [Cycloclasticus sp.]HIL92719.1 sorbosone dehydrogenase family protein [Cycloclasticus sp.]